MNRVLRVVSLLFVALTAAGDHAEAQIRANSWEALFNLGGRMSDSVSPQSWVQREGGRGEAICGFAGADSVTLIAPTAGYMLYWPLTEDSTKSMWLRTWQAPGVADTLAVRVLALVCGEAGRPRYMILESNRRWIRHSVAFNSRTDTKIRDELGALVPAVIAAHEGASETVRLDDR